MCSNCSNINPVGAKFCAACGSDLRAQMPADVAVERNQLAPVISVPSAADPWTPQAQTSPVARSMEYAPSASVTGDAPALVTIHNHQMPVALMVAVPEKSVALAAVLGFFFGPLGMLYASVTAALVMFGVNVVVGIVTFGLGLFVTIPICAVVAAMAAQRHNDRLRALALPAY